MARASNTEERRAQIVRGLQRVMAERGYERASVGAIARAAGLAPGLVHYHFANKEAILLALVEHIADRLEQRLERRLQVAGSPWERLDAFIDALLALDQDADPEAVACWALIGADAQRLPDVRALYQGAVERQVARLTDLVAEVLAAEGGDGATAPSCAVGLMAAVEGAFRLACGAPGVVPPGQAAGIVRRMARGLLEGS